MRCTVLSVLISLLLLLGGCASVHQKSGMAVLFVGDELTANEDIPGMVQALAAKLPVPPIKRVEMLAEPGARLADRLDDGRLKAVLMNQAFDVVVLQDRRSYPLCSVRDPGCLRAASALTEATALARTHGARVVVFSTYQVYPPVQQILTMRVQQLATVLKIDVADLGQSLLRYTLKRPQTPALTSRYELDVSGALLAAATVLRTLTATPLPPMQLDKLCRTPWRGQPLSADKLASQQTPPAAVCTAPSIETQQAIWQAVNHN
jgi:hypothetical protein